MMEEKVREYIDQLEKSFGIRILLVCEAGSRAWGFPSPDSDYDIRFIYKHEKNWYLGLTEERDTIELMSENNNLDFSGWDLRKSLRLLWKSNPPLLEWIHSPVVYKADAEFLEGINIIANQTYSRISNIHHYLSMARNSLSEIENSGTVKLKKLFYALRASVACKWILERDAIPPVAFPKMIDKLDIDDHLKNRIHELIILKSTSCESYLHHQEEELAAFMNECLEKAQRESGSLPSSKGNMKDLNAFFIKTLTD